LSVSATKNGRRNYCGGHLSSYANVCTGQKKAGLEPAKNHTLRG
jgi:hypothetical protein